MIIIFKHNEYNEFCVLNTTEKRSSGWYDTKYEALNRLKEIRNASGYDSWFRYKPSHLSDEDWLIIDKTHYTLIQHSAIRKRRSDV